MSSKDKTNVEPTDDLDDLDDILDEFNAPVQATAAPSGTTKDAKPPTTHSKVADDSETGLPLAPAGDSAADAETEAELNERFAKELAQGMEALMKGVNPDGVGGGAAAAGQAPDVGEGAQGENLMSEEEMMKQFEQMMADMGFGQPGAVGAGEPSAAAASTGGPSTRASAGAGPAQPPANFQDAIRSTMSRLRESDQTASSSTGEANEMDFEKLMAAFGNVEGAEGEEGIASMLENMMSELMSKDVLYDPLKELRDKYPGYLANPPGEISAEDRARYENQQRIVRSVVATFENPKYDNGTEEEKQALKGQVQNLMNEMQDSGAPPQEIIGDLPPELGNMPGMGDENCTVM